MVSLAWPGTQRSARLNYFAGSLRIEPDSTLLQASQGGSTYIYQYRGNNLRQIYWARYVDWFFTTPLLLLDILLIAGVPVGTTMWSVCETSFSNSLNSPGPGALSESLCH